MAFEAELKRVSSDGKIEGLALEALSSLEEGDALIVEMHYIEDWSLANVYEVMLPIIEAIPDTVRFAVVGNYERARKFHAPNNVLSGVRRLYSAMSDHPGFTLPMVVHSSDFFIKMLAQTLEGWLAKGSLRHASDDDDANEICRQILLS